MNTNCNLLIGLFCGLTFLTGGYAAQEPINEKTLNKIVKYHNKNSDQQIDCKLESGNNDTNSKAVCQRMSAATETQALSDDEFNKIFLGYKKQKNKVICKREKKNGYTIE